MKSQQFFQANVEYKKPSKLTEIFNIFIHEFNLLHIRNVSITQSKWSFQNGLYAIIRSNEWKGNFAIFLNHNAVEHIITILYGGNSVNTNERNYTKLDVDVITYFVKLFIKELPFNDLDFVAIRKDYPENIELVNITLNLEVGDIHLLIPFHLISHCKYFHDNYIDDTIWEEHIVDKLSNTNITVEARLGTITRPFAEISDLQVGNSIIFKDRFDGESIGLFVGNNLVAKGIATVVDNFSKGVLITNSIMERNDG